MKKQINNKKEKKCEDPNHKGLIFSTEFCNHDFQFCGIYLVDGFFGIDQMVHTINRNIPLSKYYSLFICSQCGEMKKHFFKKI